MMVTPTRTPGFAEECTRQGAIADTANGADPELSQFEEATAADIAEYLNALETEHREAAQSTPVSEESR